MTASSSELKVKLLLVDDDQKFCKLVTEYLKPFGYEVESAFTGPDGLKSALKGGHHAVILDVMLPGLDGFELLRVLRRESDVPVLMLTSRGDEIDRIVGLEIGADDYLPKTFSSRELLARLRAVTRRSFQVSSKPKQAAEIPLIIGGLRVDPSSRSAALNNEPLDLTPIEFDLLLHLARSPGRALTRDYLLNIVGDRCYEVFDRSIDVHISSLRRKMGDDPKNPKYIRTVRSAGYMFLDQPSEIK